MSETKMMKALRTIFFLALAFTAASLDAQWTVVVQDEDTIRELRTGDTLTFDAEGAGDIVTQRVLITYGGADGTLGTVNEPAIEGSTRFTVFTTKALPITLAPGQSADFTLRFEPTGVGPFISRVRWNLVRSNFGRGAIGTTFLLNLNGRVADWTLSFQLPGGNQTLLPDGAILNFDATEVEASQTATVVVTNRGSGPGTVQSVAVDGGSVFEASGLQLLPVEVDAGRDLRFSIIFTPPAEGPFNGNATVNFGLGAQTAGLAGEGVAAIFSYETIIDSAITPVIDRDTITLPATPVGQEIVVQVRVSNTGSLEGVITRITASGAGFKVDDLPVVPQTMNPGEFFIFTLKFTPDEPGPTTGQLLIGDARFTVIGQGSGSSLTYQATSQTGTVDVEPRATVVFAQTPLGAQTDIAFRVKNTGNAAQPLNSIGVTGASYHLSNLPALPLSLAEGQAISFTVEFEPDDTGPRNGALSIDSVNFPLTGVGANPDPLPPLTIEGPGGNVDAAAQVPVSIELSDSFPLDVTGTLTLAFTSDAFTNDPAVQFSTGGRTVRFRIRKGDRLATFTNNSNFVRFQTGTVAGAISLTASFEAEGTDVELTPDPAPELAYSVARSAPELRNLTVSASNVGLNVVVTGLSTPRSLSSMTVSFSGKADTNITTPTINVDVATAFAAWYSSGQSSSFGSGFNATLTFQLDGSLNDLASVSVTATNENGQSNQVSADAPGQ